MNEIKHRDSILEAIDQLRRRKARPDINRICNFMTRRFSVDTKDTKADLQKCIEKEIVYKVEYKGNISYRNAAKKSYGQIKRDHHTALNNLNLHHQQQQQVTKVNFDENDINIKLFANIVTTAIAELILLDSDFLDFGVPVPELMRRILMKEPSKYTKKTLTDLVQKEIENGGLIKMDNGNVSLGRTSDHEQTNENNNGQPIKIKKKPGPKPGKRKNDLEKLRPIEPFTTGIRMGGRRKRAKKVFDPSDNNLPRANRKRGRPLGSLNKSTIEKQTAASLRTPDDHSPGSRPTSRASNISAGGGGNSTGSKDLGGVCSVCHGQGNKSDKMISCRECSNKAHVSCLQTDDALLRTHPDNTWQCPHCKTCVVCYETSDAGPLTACSICADTYHSFCHEPKIPDKIKGVLFKWFCTNCQMEPLLIDGKPPKTEVNKIEDPQQEQTAPSSPVSDRYSPFFKSSPTTPPALSPDGLRNGDSTVGGGGGEGTQSSSSTEYKYCNLSDSQSDGDGNHLDPTIPDASNWTSDDVYKYFLQYFPDEAIVFKDQEIDGHSLLLMKRMDVLTSLNLKLGPALKIYRHVLKLQVRRDDHKLYWL